MCSLLRNTLNLSGFFLHISQCAYQNLARLEKKYAYLFLEISWSVLKLVPFNSCKKCIFVSISTLNTCQLPFNVCRLSILRSAKAAGEKEKACWSPRFKEQKDKVWFYSPLLVGCQRIFPTCLTYFWVIVFFFHSYVICPGIMFTRRSQISWPRYPWLFLQWLRSCLRIYLARPTRNPPKHEFKFHITCSDFLYF